MRTSMAAGVWIFGLVATAWAQAEPIPYDYRNPVIFVQDGGIESGFMDVYLMALQSAGVIDLRGMITSTTWGEENRQPPYSPVPDENLLRERRELIDKGRRSGFRNIPDTVAGPTLTLWGRRPASGRIEDTIPFGTPGSWLIVNEARAASTARPLVVVMGGDPTAVADAYLLDPTIADRVIVAWQAGYLRADGTVSADGSFNMSVDPWASYIVTERLRAVLFVGKGYAEGGIPQTPKSWLSALPDTEIRQLMTEAGWPRDGYFWEPLWDIDCTPAIALTRSDYVIETRRYSISYWEPSPWTAGVYLPVYAPDPSGNLLAVIRASEPVATQEWWARATAPEAWGPSVGQVPYGSWTVPGAVEAEHFDHGGEGRAYHDATNNFTDASWFNPIRFLEHVDILGSGSASGGFFVGRAVAGEWLEYGVDVSASGTYTIDVRVASAGPGGAFRIEVDGVDMTGSIAVPDAGAWTTVSILGVSLSAGPQTVRLVMESDGPGGEVGAFDRMTFTLATPASPGGGPPGGGTSGGNGSGGGCGATGLEAVLLLAAFLYLKR